MDYNRHACRTSTTNFTLKDGFESTLEDVVAPSPEHPDTLQEARRARGSPQPTQPTRQEMEEHALTRMPYTGAGVQFASKQKASKMPTNNNSQSSQSYRLTLRVSRHLQMSKALQYLQQLMYNHSYAWHLQYKTKQCSMTT